MIELSFLEILRELLILFTPDVTFYEITGGNDQLPKAFTNQLKDNIFYGHKCKENLKMNKSSNYLFCP